MIILTIKTDNPKAEIALYDSNNLIDQISWQAHKRLSHDILQKIDDLLSRNSKKLEDLDGIIIFKGPGSFTGLRIGMSVANALSYSHNLPIVSTDSDDWLKIGIDRLNTKENDRVALPEYGGPAFTTRPRK